MPWWDAVAREYYNSNVTVIGVCSWTSSDEAHDFITANPLSIRYAIDPAGDSKKNEITSLYGVEAVPATFVIDQNGMIVDGQVSMDPEDIDTDLQSLGVGRGTPRQMPARRQRAAAQGANRQVYVPPAPIKLKGYMSAKVVDPYASLTEPAALTKANALLAKRKFDDLAALTKSMDKRGQTKKLGQIYNALGDHSLSESKDDEAWGWYLLTSMYATDPGLVAHARFGIADYLNSDRHEDKAREQWQAIVDMPGVADVDKVRAQGLLDSTK